MFTGDVKRVAEIPKENRNPGIANLPEETHIASGMIEGHGTTSLASEKAKISGRIISLDRTASGGLSYQLAIYVQEPTVAAPPAPKSDADLATEYLSAKGLKDEEVKAHIAKFGAQRILAMREQDLANREKQLNEELAETLGLTK